MGIPRRTFLQHAVAGVGAAFAGSKLGAAEKPERFRFDPYEMVPLGKTGLKVSRVGFGTGMRGGMRQSNQTRLGERNFDALLKHCYDQGIRLFDLADTYGSHTHFARAMKSVSREKYVITTKIWLHRGGLPGWIPFWQEVAGRAAYQEALAAVEPIAPPGDTTVYSDLGFMMLGFLVEEVGGAGLDEFLRERLFAPLGMGDSGFNPDSSLWPRVAPTEVDTVYRFTHVHGVVHDENAFALGGVAGHAGLFSSARDLAVFAQMMLDGGTLARCPALGAACAGGAGPVKLVEPATIAAFTARQDAASRRALGWDTPNGGSSGGDYLSYSAFGHTGFTGTSIWMDPELDVFVVLLTTRVNPTRENQKHIPLRRALHDAVAQAISDVAIQRRAAAPNP